ncbi:MAG: transporter [Frankiales bacterium]|nr:transporter [Frankiales bacterium]
MSLFAPAYRLTSVAILMLMTIIAFEAMAVATALPTAARSLHGLAAYGWSFTGFLVASLVGMVISGLASDRRGPVTPLLAGLVLFVTGLLIAGSAQAMWQLVGGRVVQGLSTGLLITAMYVVLGVVYPEELRPRIFAALSTAWIVPGLVGPIVAGWLTEHLSWRWVFSGLAPFVVVGGLLMLPSLLGLRRSAQTAHADTPPGIARIGYALLAAFGVAAVANLGEHHGPVPVAVGAVGVVALVVGLRRLVPTGTFRFGRGVPAVVAFRGVLGGTFVGMESTVPLTLTLVHGYSPTVSGLPLILSALSWAAGSQVQTRTPPERRPVLVRAGLACIAGAGVGMSIATLVGRLGVLSFFVWPLAGLGAGLALTTVSVTLLDFTTDADRGSDSAALQLADSTASALSTAFAGALVAIAASGTLSYPVALAVVFTTMAAIAGLAIPRAGQIRPSAVRS